jgi:hypothetical protein
MARLKRITVLQDGFTIMMVGPFARQWLVQVDRHGRICNRKNFAGQSLEGMVRFLTGEHREALKDHEINFVRAAMALAETAGHGDDFKTV